MMARRADCRIVPALRTRHAAHSRSEPVVKDGSAYCLHYAGRTAPFMTFLGQAHLPRARQRDAAMPASETARCRARVACTHKLAAGSIAEPEERKARV